MRQETKEPRRHRSIRWKVTTDEKAKSRAHERHLDGGVSELVEILVLKDWAKAHPLK